MKPLGFILGVALSQPSPANPEPRDDVGVVAPTRIESIIVRAPDAIAADLREALQARLPNRHLLPFEASSFGPRDSLYAFVEVAEIPEGRDEARVAIILSDGRAYFRELRADPQARTRALAPLIANTIFAIEEEGLAPDVENAPMPEAPASPEPVTKPTEPAPPKPRPAPEPSDASAPTPEPRWEVGPAIMLGAIMGLGAPLSHLGFAGLAGRFRALARHATGATVVGSLRLGGWAREGYGLLRIRIDAGGGYVLRRGRFELPILAVGSVEPWLVSREGSSVDVGQGPHVLLGGALELTPSVHVRLRSGVSLRVGAVLELSASSLPSGAAARIAAPPDDELFELGGLELMTGAELALGWPRSPRA